MTRGEMYWLIMGIKLRLCKWQYEHEQHERIQSALINLL